MTTPPPDATPLTEDEAHRVLARAVELDERTADEISIAQLRRIAEERRSRSILFARSPSTP